MTRSVALRLGGPYAEGLEPALESHVRLGAAGVGHIFDSSSILIARKMSGSMAPAGVIGS